MISANTVRAQGGGIIHSYDHDTTSDCTGGGANSITGAIARVSVTEETSSAILGSPDAEIWSGGYAAMLDSIALRWDVLSDPQFPVEFDDTWPNFASLPADSFPIVRHTGWLSTNVVGRGVLIVVGTFDPGSSFAWDGIVLASHVDDYIEGTLRGLLVGGLDGPNAYSTVYVMANVEYHSCSVYAANETLSYLELVRNTVYEVN